MNTVQLELACLGMKVLKTSYDGFKLTLLVQYKHGQYELTEIINGRNIREVQASIAEGVKWLQANIINDANWN